MAEIVCLNDYRKTHQVHRQHDTLSEARIGGNTAKQPADASSRVQEAFDAHNVSIDEQLLLIELSLDPKLRQTLLSETPSDHKPSSTSEHAFYTKQNRVNDLLRKLRQRPGKKPVVKEINDKDSDYKPAGKVIKGNFSSLGKAYSQSI